MDLSCQKHRMITWIELTNKQLSLQGDSRVEQQNEGKTREEPLGKQQNKLF